MCGERSGPGGGRRASHTQQGQQQSADQRQAVQAGQRQGREPAGSREILRENIIKLPVITNFYIHTNKLNALKQ